MEYSSSNHYVFMFIIPMLAVFLQTSQHSSSKGTSHPIAIEISHGWCQYKKLEQEPKQDEDK